MTHITVIGGGLAGVEAAWQAAQHGVRVTLAEMRPQQGTPAHKTGLLAELVCSNSLGGMSHGAGSGLLKEELRRLGSLVVATADRTALPAGNALAVDRERFARDITDNISAHPLIAIVREEATALPPGICVVATGPLTSAALAGWLAARTGQHQLYFYDAAGPVLVAASVDESKGFWADRYGKGGNDYFNCPLTKEEYLDFHAALIAAEKYTGHNDEDLKFFAGCQPIEELAASGVHTMRFGPLRPVGLHKAGNGAGSERMYAVVQLRRENAAGTLLNMVGFQTRLKQGEQRRVFRLVSALHAAEFVRYGMMHRNTYLNSPQLLAATYQWKQRPEVFFAGQITGVEGYVESAASGLLAGRNAAHLARGQAPLVPPAETMCGALALYITAADPAHFQPMNANFGLLPPLPGIRDAFERKLAMAARSLASMERWQVEVGW